MSPTTTDDIRIEVHPDGDDWTAALHREARDGLAAPPKHLSPTWLYDDRGSELFDVITELSAHNPTRTARAILAERAEEVARPADADTLVELGSGTSDKTRIVLDAMASTGRPQRRSPSSASWSPSSPSLRCARSWWRSTASTAPADPVV
jgi:L-histidine N-alpha-methyltransferase